MAETQSREGRHNGDDTSFSPPAGIQAEDFRLDDAAIQADPYAYYPLLRVQRPVLQTNVGSQPWWVLSRQEDVARALMDHQTFSSRTLPDASILFLDPPEHDRLRAIAVPWFSRTAIHKLAEPIAKSAEDLIGAAVAAGKCDIVSDVALKLTWTMIGEMLGVPLDSVQQLHALRNHGPGFLPYLQARRLDKEPSPQAHAANNAFNSVRGGIIDGGHVEGGVVADLVASLQRGEITDAECKSYINILFGAGHSTTTDSIGNAVYVLAARPDDLDRLAQDETFAGKFLEEVLRTRPSFHRIPRITTREVEIGGVTIPARSLVRLLLASANRDDSIHEDPEAFDPDKKRRMHRAFGKGIHTCLGNI